MSNQEKCNVKYDVEDNSMFEQEFRKRLTELRELNKISARDMSLSIGQNPSYIHFIETGKSMPSMSAFLSICDYLNITPSEFFDTKNAQPERMREIIKNLQKLDNDLLTNIAIVISNLAK